MKVSIIQNFVEPIKESNIGDVIEQIKEGKYELQVKALRKLLLKGKKDEYDIKKKLLHGFTTSGTFSYRESIHLKEYSGYVMIDFDGLTIEQTSNNFLKISCDPYTFSCFRSPSNHGLKVIVKVSSSKEQHAHVYKKVQHYYESLTELKADPKCKDIARLCFFSYDPDLYKNETAKPFDMTLSDKTITFSKESYDEDFKRCVTDTKKIMEYKEGNSAYTG